ncbi:MAG TPA: high-potential iron-sulfur protein [Rhodanobacteraceae bacterium]|nr:high-potential iron-sulfur protein [Rhodanobacteraceae bacterium]
MSSKPVDVQARRRFLKLAAVGAVAAPIGAGLMSKFARAADLPHLEESDPTAAALGYKHDVSQVDKAKYPQFKPGQECGNCQFFQGKPGDVWGPCQLFPGKATNTKGWCAGYNAKA